MNGVTSLPMNRRSLLQALATTPFALRFPRVDKPTSALALFYSDEDYVIARDPADAAAVFVEETGPYAWVVEQGQPPGIDPDDWLRWPEKKPFTLVEELEPSEYLVLWEKMRRHQLFDVAGGMVSVDLTEQSAGGARGYYRSKISAYPRWWIKERGRCLLASRDG